MKPAPFDYVRAESITEIVELLSEYGDDARILAGGQSLVPMLSMRLARPRVLVDINRIGKLDGYRNESGMLVVGAAVRQASLESSASLVTDAPLLASAMPWLGHWQTRARGTVAGSIAHADPSAELPLCLTALDGVVVLQSSHGVREVAARDFFQGTMQTAMHSTEFVGEVKFPLADPGAQFRFAEFGRRHGDFAIVACAAVREASTVSLSVGGVGDTPLKYVMPDASVAAVDDFVNELAWSLDARDDNHASARLRRDLVRSMGGDLLREVFA